jgi:hypothetical protein
MYAIRKPIDNKADVFISWPAGGMAKPLSEIVQWLVDHKTSFGYVNGSPVGVYLAHIDAVAFKLKFGL